MSVKKDYTLFLTIFLGNSIILSSTKSKVVVVTNDGIEESTGRSKIRYLTTYSKVFCNYGEKI